MSKVAQLALLSMIGLMSRPKMEQMQIQSYKIERKEEEIQLSKRQIQKLKGKKARKNRGRKR